MYDPEYSQEEERYILFGFNIAFEDSPTAIAVMLNDPPSEAMVSANGMHYVVDRSNVRCPSKPKLDCLLSHRSTLFYRFDRQELKQ